MADNTIKYQLDVVGADKAVADLDKVSAAGRRTEAVFKKLGGQAIAGTNVSKLADDQKKLSSAVGETAKATDRASESQKRYFGHIARTTIQSALINKLFLELVDVSGQAIQQVDAMQNFPATMASMGQSTKSAGEAFQSLRDYVGEVGGNLGEATSYVTRFTGATGSVKAATAIFVGLNNALIAGDSSAQEQAGAMLQFAQALERGKIEAKEWNILTQNMSFQLNQVAQSMGYVNSSALRDAMTSGEESMASFTVAMAKMSTGTGAIVTQAEARMNGMQFAFNRMKNTMVQGLSAIINAIGRQNIVSFFSFMAQVIQVLAGWIVRLINLLVTLFNFFARLFGLPAIQLKKDVAGIADGIGTGADNAGDLKDGLDDAGDSAKKLNKSLAAFDKMNVLPDKESDSGGKKAKDAGGGAGAGFDPGQIGELEDLFANLGGGLEEASKWAKIFAGVLAGIAGVKFAQAIINQIDGVAKSFKTAASGLGTFKKALVGGLDKEGNKVDGLAQKIGNIPTIITGKIPGMQAAFARLGGFLTNPYVLLAAAIAAVVGGIIYLYKTNEDFKKGFDSVWNGAAETVKGFVKVIKSIIQPALDNLQKAWKDMLEAIKPITIFLQPLIDKFKEWWKALFPTMTGMELLGKIVGTVAKAIAVVLGGAIAGVIITVTLLATAIIWLVTKIIEIGTAVYTYITQNFGGALETIKNFITGGIDLVASAFTTAKDAIVGFVTGGVDLISTAFTTAKDAIVTFVTDGIEFVGEKFTEFAGWIEDHKTHLINWGIVITTILLPKIVQIGAHFAVVAAQAVASFATMVASSVASAISTAAAWVTSLPGIIKGFAEVSKKAVIEFAKTSASAVSNAAKSAAAWAVGAGKAVLEFVKVSAAAYKNFAIASAQAAIHGAKIAASFVASAAKAALSFGVMVVQFVAGLATMAAQLAIKAVQMAISWALALGPIGLAIAVVAGAIALIIANWDVVKEAAGKAWQFIQEKIDQFTSWLKENWPLVLAIITGPIGLAVLAIVKNWETIKEAIATAIEWVKTNWPLILAIITGPIGLAVLAIVKNWDTIKEAFAKALEWIKNLWNSVIEFFKGLWEGIKNAFSAVGTWFRDTFQKALDSIKSVFSTLWTWFRDNVWGKITSVFSSIGTSIGDAVSGAFKGVINTAINGVSNIINNFIRTINGAINIINKIPGVNISRINEISLPRLARGGVVDQPTAAILGEDGKEAVIPLENNMEWLDKLAAKINTATGGNGQPVQLTVQIGEEKIVNKVIELINEKTQMGGRNTILV